MSETLKETVTIDSLGKWGPKIGGAFYSYSKNFKDQAKVVPGATLEIETWISDSGKKYVNKVLGTKEIAAAAPAKAAKAPAPKADAFKPRDFDAEARGKTRCALFEAALQSPALNGMTDVGEIVEMVTKLSNAGFAYVFPEDSK